MLLLEFSQEPGELSTLLLLLNLDTGFHVVIDFKVLLLVYKSLNGLGHKCSSDMLEEYKPRRSLRSLGSSHLIVPRVRIKCGEAASILHIDRNLLMFLNSRLYQI